MGMEMLHGSAGVQTAKALKYAAVCLMLLPRFLLAAVMLWLLDFLCIRRKVLTRMRESDLSSPDDPPLCVSDSNKMFTLESLRAVWYGQKLDFFKTAHLGGAAPNTERVARQYADIADSLLVYIEEAHPSDGWVSSDAPYQIPRHRCLEDRLRAAQLMNQEVPGSAVVVDTMENSSNSAYGAYFERLYILKDEKVVYQGGRGPEGYRISELRDWLERYRNDLEASKAATVVHV
ncbi:Thyroxine 5-deiodinase [Labeo rohita]|uniref:Iodothyronine deiodinase n=1 Tax=Labeo rohita TaxID=84645 RepID=A0ABQ8LNX9_LABRO|nr:Thyroxine 5-deiodinase [Labeo rohita]